MPDLTKMPLQQARLVLTRMRVTIDARSARTSGSPNVIVAQTPTTGAYVAPGDTVVLCWVDPPPPPTAPPARADTPIVRVPTPTVRLVRMPPLVGRSYATAAAIIRALPSATGFRSPIIARGMNDKQFDPTRSVVDSQRPMAGDVLSARDVIEVVFRDTTSLVFTPAQPQAATPATIPPTQPQPIQTPPGFQPPPQLQPQSQPQSQAQTQPQSSQQSRPRAQRVVVPPLPTVRMPAVTSRTFAAAEDTLRKLIQLGQLGITPGFRGRRGASFTAARSLVDSQLPAAGTVLTGRTPVWFILRDTTTIAAQASIPNPIERHQPSTLWKWIVAAGVLLALAAIAASQWLPKRGPNPLAALQVIPHLDAGRPRVVFTVRDGERPEDAFARVGLSIRAVADPGKPLLHFPRPPRVRDEASHV
jgi:hypothetical protein